MADGAHPFTLPKREPLTFRAGLRPDPTDASEDDALRRAMRNSNQLRRE